MNFILKFEDRAGRLHPKWLDIIRVLLGIILMIKGISFIDNKDILFSMLQESGSWLPSLIIIHYSIVVYICCGFAIAAGLLTRLSVLFAIPIVLGTIIFNDLHRNLFELNSQPGYSILILFMLLFFLFYGAGNFSVDNYLKKIRE